MSNSHVNQNASPTTLVTTAETVAVVMSAFSPNNPQGEGVCLEGLLNLTAGTGTTAFTIRCYRGAGVVGSAPTGLTPVGGGQGVGGGGGNAPFQFLDPTALVLNNQAWTITVQATGATANGTVNNAIVEATSCVVGE